MILRTDFLSRLFFMDRNVHPSDAVISIGDPGQEVPKRYSEYVDGIRLEFLDIEPSDCHIWDPECLFSTKHGTEVLAFIKRLHSSQEERTLIVHCEAGASRSAAIALAIHAITGCDLPPRDASFANSHVVGIMSTLLGRAIDVPPHPDYEKEGIILPIGVLF